MTEKRFTLHINWYNPQKTEGEAELKDNGQPILISEDIEDIRYLKDLLNELNDENTMLQEEIKDFQTLLASREETFLKPIIRQIEEAYKTERTQIGKNVLKQLMESL